MNTNGVSISIITIWIIVMIYIFKTSTQSLSGMVHVRASSGRTYLVRDLDDKREAAALLDRVVDKIKRLCELFHKKYGTRNKAVNRMCRRFNPNTVRESSKSSTHTSYSVNKGEELVFCIRSKSGEIVDDNTVFFVALHECAHLMTISIGHKEEFWTHFRFILANAIKWKLYTWQNFNKKPIPYCGITITDTPINDQKYQKYLFLS